MPVSCRPIVLVAALLASIASAQIPSLPVYVVSNQFGAAEPPHVPEPGVMSDTIRGEFINYETLITKPIVVAGENVIVGNEPDCRIVVLNQSLSQIVAEVPLGQGISALAVRPQSNELWVSLRHQMAVAVIDMTSWQVTHLLRPTISQAQVGAMHADSPGSIVFTSNGLKAYVTATSTDHVSVYDASGHTFTTVIPLQFGHNGRDTYMNEPLAMAISGNSVFVASYRSGNQTLVESPAPPLVLPPSAPKHVITDLSNSTTRSLPDFDVMVIDTTTDTVSGVKRGIGTQLHGIAVVGSNLLISNTQARNGEFIGQKSFADGLMVRNRLTTVAIGGSANGPHTILNVENLTNVSGATPWVNIVQPTDIAVDAPGSRFFVAGYGSANIGVFSSSTSTPTFIGTIGAGSGPIGLAYDRTSHLLFCYNRADNSVSRYDVSGTSLPSMPTTTFELPDPTLDDVKVGRQVFLKPDFSAKQTGSCASCHAHLRNDGTTWELSSYYDDETPLTFASASTVSWRDRKGPMQTQTLQNLIDVGRFHWRAEQPDLEAFNEMFTLGLKGTGTPSVQEFANMKSYVFSAVRPANPFAQMNGNLSDMAKDGLLDDDPNSPEFAISCQTCHLLPSGTDTGLTDLLLHMVNQTALATKTAPLRGIQEKISDLAIIDPNSPTDLRSSLGTALLHDGSVKDLETFISSAFPGILPVDVTEFSRFIKEMSTGIMPAANYSEWLTSSSPNAGHFLVEQADPANIRAEPRCDIAVHGWKLTGSTWKALGYYYDRSTNLFIPSDSTEAQVTLAQLQASTANDQARWLLLGVPVGSGERIGIDRDRDMLKDLDEVAAGTLPDVADSDGDGYWDGYDTAPTNTSSGMPTTGAPAITNIVFEFTNSSTVKVCWRTSTLSPTRIEYDVAGASILTHSTGDPFPLPTGTANNSNLWKRDHTAYIRGLTASTAWQFRILTQAQNNAQDTTQPPITMYSGYPIITMNDENVGNGKISIFTTIGMTKQVVGGTHHKWTATVTCVDHAGAPVQGLLVAGRFTTLTQGLPTSQNVTAHSLTDSSGVVSFDNTVPLQSSGDGMAFDLPMNLEVSGQVLNTIYHPNDILGTFVAHNFQWSKSQTHEEEILP